MKNIVFLVVLLVFDKSSASYEKNVVSQDVRQPLLLTSLIKARKIEEAQAAAEVKFDAFGNVKSYSGYLTVDETFNSNLFFWFFPSENDYENDPVLLWLQGGPGASSLYGLFIENGPFQMKNNEEVEPREYSWTKHHSVLYIDNPVGAGFSFTNNGYAQNQTIIGEHLYTALIQFFTLFPNLQKNNFYVTGESYAGKYIPSIAYAIYKNNPDANIKINLKGLTIGNGFCELETQFRHSDYLYAIGLIDSNTRYLLKQYEQQAADYVKSGEAVKAYEIVDFVIKGTYTMYPTVFKNVTGFDNYYNLLFTKEPSNETSYMTAYLQRADVRKAIHTGNIAFGDEAVSLNLITEYMQSVGGKISELLSNYPVLFYNGQLDISVAYPLTLNFLQNLNFSASEEYKTAPRYQWYVGGELAGYSKQAGNLTEVLVRAAGHMVPHDQPKWAYDLIYRFTRKYHLH